MHVRFQALLIGLVLFSAAAIALVVWSGDSRPSVDFLNPAKRAKLTTIATRVAAENNDRHATATVVATTQPKLFRLNHRSGTNSGLPIFLIILHGNFKTGNISVTRTPNYAYGNEIVLEYTRDLQGLGFTIHDRQPNLLKLGPATQLIPSG